MAYLGRSLQCPCITPQAATWLTVSNPSRILATSETMPPAQIFGSEPARTWCYYYEKAELAAQYGDWPTAVVLWRDAASRRLRAANSIELLPFIAASARLDDWEQAKTLTAGAQALPDRSTLCFVTFGGTWGQRLPVCTTGSNRSPRGVPARLPKVRILGGGSV